MKKMTATLLLAAIGLLTVWCWGYGSYLALSDRLDKLATAGDWQGAKTEIDGFLASKIYMVMDRFAVLSEFRDRLRYNEGAICARLGDMESAVKAFELTKEAGDRRVAAFSLYNLGLYALGRNDYETARAQFSNALGLHYQDQDMKVNLELVIRKIKAREEQAHNLLEESERKPALERQPGEQWRLDIPEDEGPGAESTGRSYL